MLELKNVKKSYDGTPVLTDISLNIEDGEIVSILGPSGCGKTTLLNLILGIVDADGKWRFTSPTHVVLAFAQAMKELEEEGGIEARSRRYTENNRLLIEKMGEMGIRPYIDSTHQGPIITTFFYPEKCHFTFSQMYEYIKDRGYAIYPGKVTEAETFRIGNIGEIYKEDIEKVCAIMKEFLEEYNHEED